MSYLFVQTLDSPTGHYATPTHPRTLRHTYFLKNIPYMAVYWSLSHARANQIHSKFLSVRQQGEMSDSSKKQGVLVETITERDLNVPTKKTSPDTKKPDVQLAWSLLIVS